ncbi:hypothetical protein ISP17_11380 [Dyella ginsengisoli]|uniref:Uncharacterized protein n=1 Tax=Dyella ginsengisoli TaxID=363848 RepID=A0ABW8JUH8_9GAMM
MADNLSCSIPAQITAGDTAIWQRPGGNYRASDGWTLAYAFVGTASVYSATAAANGDDFLVTIAASATATWAPGAYSVQEYVTNGTERHTLSTTRVQVLPDLTAVPSGGLDTRSHAQKVLDAINGYLETKAPVYGAMEINARKISYYPVPELLQLRDRFRREVLTEQRVASGQRGGNRILAVL